MMDRHPIIKAIVFCFIFSALCKPGDAGCTTDKVLADADAHVIEEGKIVGFTCQGDLSFDDGTSMAVSYCKDGQWSDGQPICKQDVTAPTCDNTAIETPAESEIVSTTVPETSAKVYQCLNEKQWLSGYKHQFSLCKNNAWTKINDMCDTACNAPKDCSDVYDLGLKTDGVYKVVPSGVATDSVHMVNCQMPSEGDQPDPLKWTDVLRIQKGSTIDWTTDNYKDSTNNHDAAATSDYFVGLEYLSKLSASSADDPIVLQVRFMDAANNVLEKATFSNFSIGAGSTYPLSSIGTYHGDAGNGLCPHVNMPFEFGDGTAGPRWWGDAESSEFINMVNGSFVTKFLWASKDMANVEVIEMKLRRTSAEMDICPPFIGSESYWTTTNFSIAHDRKVGSQISYSCTDPFMYEGKIDATLEEKSQNGVITCISDEAGGRPKWDKEVVLPCVLHCPSGFNLSRNGSVCYHVSDKTATGYVSAAHECKNMNGTLASMASVETTREENTTYYLAESIWGTTVSTMSPDYTDQNYTTCPESEVCEISEDNECTLLSSNATYTHAACNQSVNYICQFPGLCPNGYTRVGASSCYQVVDQSGNFAEAVKACANIGGVPANPVTMAEFDSMNQFLVQDAALAGIKVLIGNNKADSTWTSNGLYEEPDEELLAKLNDASEDLWRYIEVGVEGISTDSTQTATTKVICEYPGPIACNNEAPEPLELMSQTIITSEQTAGSVATYECSPGYFLESNTSLYQQNQQCLVTLGQWVMDSAPFQNILVPCIKKEVCTTAIVTPDSMEQTINDDSKYLNGTVLMTCNDNLSLMDSSTSFNLTCSGNETAGYSYEPTPIPLCERCIKEIPEVPNAQLVSYDSATAYKIGDTIETNCLANFEHSFRNGSQVIRCTSEGWTRSEISDCYPVCSQQPFIPDTNIEPITYEDNKIGATLTYKCPEGKVFERNSVTDEQLLEFTIACQENNSWEPFPVKEPVNCIDPPCPIAYKESSDGKCYSFENSATVSGYFDAIKKCWEKEGTLATTSAQTLIDTEGQEGMSYFTVERAITPGTFTLSVDASVSCPTGGCSDGEADLCTVLNADKTYNHVSCSDSFNFICQHEGYCPDGYTNVKGRCYKVIEQSGIEALKACAAEGSSLAHPVTAEQFKEMAAGLFANTDAEVIALIGSNNVDGTWTSGGLFAESDEDMTNMLVGGEATEKQLWRALKVSPPDDYTLIPVEISSETLTKSICMHAVPSECTTDPPEAKENMKMVGDVSKSAGTVLEYKCDDGHFVGGDTAVTSQELSCLGSAGGWYPTELKECVRVKVCLEIPTVPSDLVEMTSDENSMYFGGVVNYTCAENMTTSTFDSEIRSTCNKTDTGFDFSTQTIPDCNVCNGTIPEVEKVTLVDYVNTTAYTVDHTIVANCEEFHEFVGGESSTEIKCTKTGWEYTHTNGCVPVCPNTLPEAGDNVTVPTEFSNEIKAIVNYTCDEGMHFVMNEEHTKATQIVEVTCEEDKTWKTNRTLEELKCVSLCPMDPPEIPELANSTWDNTSRLLDHEVNYTCMDGYNFGTNEQLWTMTCNGSEWHPPKDDNFTCYIITTTQPPPTTPYLPPIADNDLYKNHVDLYMGTISDMTNTQGRPAKKTLSPVPFNNGVILSAEDEECYVKDQPYSCFANPGYENCTNGISYSIWARMTPTELDERRYYLSTGGDMDGHPGISLYQEGFYTTALVSVGDKFWNTTTYYHMPTEEWTVIGVRWDLDNGIELFQINKTTGNMVRHGHSKIPHPSSTGLIKPGLHPPQLIVGCHKDQTNQEYRYFMDGSLDEAALWLHTITDENLSWFTGGYRISSWRAPDALAALKNSQIDLKDGASYGQLASSLATTQEKDIIAKQANAEVESSTKTSTSTAESTTNSDEPMNITVSADDLEDLNSTMTVIVQMTDEDSCPNEVSETTMDGYLIIQKLYGRTLTPSPVNKETWKQIASAEKEKEIFSLTERVNKFTFCALQKVPLPNDTRKFQKAVTTDHSVVVASKRKLGDIINARQLVLPDPVMVLPDNFQGKVKLATSPRQFNDPRCENRSLSTLIGIYDSMDEIGSLDVDKAEFEETMHLSFDSVIISYAMDIDDQLFGDGEKDTSQPNCGLGTQEGHHIVLEFEHTSGKPAQPRRHLLSDESSGFFEPAIETDILDRFCAWRNPDLGVTGVWDRSTCKLVRTSSASTTCTCGKEGTYAIVSEILPPKNVAEEPYWLWLTKYILYGLSIVCIIIYLLAVALSGDLKDQFHLAGANLGVALLIGTISMILSDQDFVRESRDFCGSVSTLILFFYLASGAWCLAIGHICFKAITAGVIRGKLSTYMCMTWGFSLTMVGVVYMFFLHDIGTDPRCFVAWENDVKICLFFPQIVLSLGGLFYSCVIFCNMSTPALRKDNLIDDYGSFCRGTATMLIVFAATWTFGLLAYVRMGLTIDFFPAFTIFNAAMGIVLLLLIGFASNRFRTVLTGQAKKRRDMLRQNAFGLPGMKRGYNRNRTNVSKIPSGPTK